MRKILILCLLLLFVLPAGADGLVTIRESRGDLVKVLKRIAAATGKNIYVGPEVAGQVTVDLRQVPAMGALDTVLRLQPKPYAYKVVGSTIVVASPERLDKIPDSLFSNF